MLQPKNVLKMYDYRIVSISNFSFCPNSLAVGIHGPLADSIGDVGD
jgi:hypothetical protein